METIRKAFAAAAFCALAVLSLPAAAQIETVDPDAAIDGDLMGSPSTTSTDSWQDPGDTTQGAQPAYEGAYDTGDATSRYDDAPVLDLPPEQAPAPGTDVQTAENPYGAPPPGTYGEDDLIGAAEGLFGRGAEGLARLIQDVLADQGEPNGYIVGREGGGAFVLGVRYGSGTLHHAVEGNMPVYWTGPSIGLDAGANAGNTFVLVYNLYDTDELYERFPAGEGQAYLVGGFTASYVRKGDVVLIPIRVGAGLRLGVNAGYMRFSRKQRWLPF